MSKYPFDPRDVFSVADLYEGSPIWDYVDKFGYFGNLLDELAQSINNREAASILSTIYPDDPLAFRAHPEDEISSQRFCLFIPDDKVIHPHPKRKIITRPLRMPQECKAMFGQSIGVRIVIKDQYGILTAGAISSYTLSPEGQVEKVQIAGQSISAARLYSEYTWMPLNEFLENSQNWRRFRYAPGRLGTS